MRRLLGARIAAALACALVVPTSMGAGATQPAAPLEGVAADAAKLAGATGVAQAVALRRMQVQDIAGEIQSRAIARYPDTFAGLWIDDDLGVTIGFTKDAVGSAAEASRGLAPVTLRAVSFGRSLASLEALQRRMVADRELAKAGKLSFPSVPDGAYDLDVDVKANTAVAVVRSTVPGTVEAFRARYGDALVVRTGPLGRFEVCTRLDCRNTLRSGLGTSHLTAPVKCTTAFTVWRGSARNTMSAAHCNGNDIGASRYHAEKRYGGVSTYQQSVRVDAEAHSVIDNSFDTMSLIWVSSSETARKVTGYTYYNATVVGANVCISGYTSGHSCNVITSTTYAPTNIPQSERFIKAEYCSDGGDSGAGVFASGSAYGIHSGGAADSAGNNLPCTDPNDFAFFGHIEYAIGALGLSFATGDALPNFDSVTGKSGTRTVTLRFSRPLRCDTVGIGDFLVKMGLQTMSISSRDCQNDSNQVVTLTLNSNLVYGLSLSVSMVNQILNPAGDPVTPQTRTTTVS